MSPQVFVFYIPNNFVVTVGFDDIVDMGEAV